MDTLTAEANLVTAQTNADNATRAYSTKKAFDPSLDKVYTDALGALAQARSDLATARGAARTNAKAALTAAQTALKTAEATCQPVAIETARRNYVQAREVWESGRA